MKRSGPPKRKTALRADPAKTREWQDRSRKPLPKKSQLQRDIDAQRPEVRAQVIARDGEACWARDLVPEVQCASPFPDRQQLELHEVIQRSLWRLGVLEPGNCRLLCQAHHDWTEDFVEQAYERGLLESSPAPKKSWEPLPEKAPGSAPVATDVDGGGRFGIP